MHLPLHSVLSFTHPPTYSIKKHRRRRKCLRGLPFCSHVLCDDDCCLLLSGWVGGEEDGCLCLFSYACSVHGWVG